MLINPTLYKKVIPDKRFGWPTAGRRIDTVLQMPESKGLLRHDRQYKHGCRAQSCKSEVHVYKSGLKLHLRLHGYKGDAWLLSNNHAEYSAVTEFLWGTGCDSGKSSNLCASSFLI